MHKRKLHIKSVLNLLLGKVGIVSLRILVQIWKMGVCLIGVINIGYMGCVAAGKK